jgi:competence protein ComEC
MPFAAYQFQQIEPYWIPANLIAVPLTALWIMPWGLAALALMPFGLASLALIPMGWGIGIIVWATTQVAAWPEALMSLKLIPASAILAYSAGLIWLCLWRTKIRFWSIAAFILAVWLATSCRPPDMLVSADARLIAVRQGDKILLLRLPKASGYTLAEWAPMFLNHKIVPITCSTARLVISPEPLRGACAALPRIDRLTVWQNGATAAWLTPLGPRMLTDRDVEGDRPWVMPWPEP